METEKPSTTYLYGVPEGIAENTDWALKLADGTLLPVHGTLLYTLSPVIAGLIGTKPPEGSRYTVEVPCHKSLSVATAFLQWIYRDQVMWTPPLAMEVCDLGYFWGVKGLKIECENYLAAELAKSDGNKRKSFSRSSSTEEFVSWLKIVETCRMETLVPSCVAELIVRWKEIRASDGYEQISGRMISSALDTVMDVPAPDEILQCKSCYSPGMQLFGSKRKFEGFSETWGVRTYCVACR